MKMPVTVHGTDGSVEKGGRVQYTGELVEWNPKRGYYLTHEDKPLNPKRYLKARAAYTDTLAQYLHECDGNLLIEWWMRDDLPQEWATEYCKAIHRPRDNRGLGESYKKSLDLEMEETQNPADYAYRTTVHYRPTDHLLEGILRTHRLQVLEPPHPLNMRLTPDLPDSPLPMDLVIETEYPRGPISDTMFSRSRSEVQGLAETLTSVLLNRQGRPMHEEPFE